MILASKAARVARKFGIKRTAREIYLNMFGGFRACRSRQSIFFYSYNNILVMELDEVTKVLSVKSNLISNEDKGTEFVDSFNEYFYHVKAKAIDYLRTHRYWDIKDWPMHKLGGSGKRDIE